MKLGEAIFLLKVKPDDKAIKGGIKRIQQQFKRVAISFGTGLKRGVVGALKGGVVTTALAAFASAIKTPFEDIKNLVNEQLGVADEIGTLAGQLSDEGRNVSVEQIVKTIGIAGASGVDFATLQDSLLKFIDAQNKGLVDSSFNTGDVLNDFLSFFNNLRLADADTRQDNILSVFGNRFAKNLFELSQSNIAEAGKRFEENLAKNNLNAKEIAKNIQKGGVLEGIQSEQKIITDLVKANETLNSINEETINSITEVERAKNATLLQDVDNLSDFARLEIQQIETNRQMREIATGLQQKIIPLLSQGFDVANNVLERLKGLSETLVGLSTKFARFFKFGG